MPLITQEFLSIFNLSYIRTYPLNTDTTGDGGLLRLGKTWQEVLGENLLLRIDHRFDMGLFKGKILWLKGGEDPYQGSKPFEILRIGLEDEGQLVVLVRGKKTDRICKKWKKKLSTFFKRSVNIIWEVDLE